jgi:hypothetical protein
MRLMLSAAAPAQLQRYNFEPRQHLHYSVLGTRRYMRGGLVNDWCRLKTQTANAQQKHLGY